MGEGKGETQSHRVGTNEKKAFVSSKGKMTPMSRNVQFGWFTASNPGRGETVKKKSEIGGGRGKKNKNLGGPAESGPAEGGVGRLSGDTNEGEQEKT